jgi:hypothetical protein
MDDDYLAFEGLSASTRKLSRVKSRASVSNPFKSARKSRKRSEYDFKNYQKLKGKPELDTCFDAELGNKTNRIKRTFVDLNSPVRLRASTRKLPRSTVSKRVEDENVSMISIYEKKKQALKRSKIQSKQGRERQAMVKRNKIHKLIYKDRGGQEEYSEKHYDKGEKEDIMNMLGRVNITKSMERTAMESKRSRNMNRKR